MKSIKFICWQDQEQWLGDLQDYPDYFGRKESHSKTRSPTFAISTAS